MRSHVTVSKGLFWVDADTLGGTMYSALRATGRDRLPDPSSIIETSVLAAAYAAGSTGPLMQAPTVGSSFHPQNRP